MAAVERAGILKLKILHMVNIKTEFPRGISDQVISSGDVITGDSTESQGVHLVRASSTKHQAQQVSSIKRQASSPEPQASSDKPQAASSVILDPWNMDIGEVLGGKGPRAFTMINVFFG